MRKNIYSLDDIGKILTYIPQIFLIVFATILIIVSYFVIEYKQKNDINLLLEQQKYINEKILNEYISQVNKKIEKYLQEIAKLKKEQKK